jgi:hypothetical protein
MPDVVARNKMADIDWTDLAKDRDVWQAIANVVKLWV